MWIPCVEHTVVAISKCSLMPYLPFAQRHFFFAKVGVNRRRLLDRSHFPYLQCFTSTTLFLVKTSIHSEGVSHSEQPRRRFGRACLAKVSLTLSETHFFLLTTDFIEGCAPKGCSPSGERAASSTLVEAAPLTRETLLLVVEI